MRKIIGIGETVYDIVFRDGQPQAGVPGGSTFNTMISAGRCGADSCFLSEVGSDRIGSLIKEFMAGNGVSTDYINTLPGKSPVSLAFLNARNDAEYSFYRDSRESHPDFRYPQIAPDDIVVFGSFYALNRVVRPQVKAFLEYARSRGAILYYDVNFRPSHKKDLGECMDSIFENFSLAHILRGSHEDFITLFEEGDPARVYDRWVGPRCSEFICTQHGQHHRGRRQFQRRDSIRPRQGRNHPESGGEGPGREAVGRPGPMCRGILLRLLRKHGKLRVPGIRCTHGRISRPQGAAG